MPTQNYGSNDINGRSFLLNPANVARVSSVAGDANLARMGLIDGSKPEITWGAGVAMLVANLNALLTVGEGPFLQLPLVGGGTLYVREATFACAIVDTENPTTRTYLWTTEGPEVRWHIALNLVDLNAVFFPA